MCKIYKTLLIILFVGGCLILPGLIFRPRLPIKAQELIDDDRRSGGYNPRSPLNVAVPPPPWIPTGNDFKIFEDHPALLDILRFSKQPCPTRNVERQEIINQLSKALEPHYVMHAANELDIHKVLYRHWWIVINEPRFQTGRTIEEKVEKLLNAAFEAKWGISGLVYPSEAPNNVEDVLYLQIRHMLTTFMLTNIGWCREVLHPEEKQMQAKSSG